jgi:hypothetical protein
MADPAKVILLYGRAGLGKTWACADLAKNPACGEVYFFDLDGGLQTIKNDKGELPPRVHAGPFIDTMVACKTQWDALKRRTGIPAEIQTLIIDSLTALELLFVAELMAHDSPHSTGEMNIPKWGKRNTLLTDYARLARSLPFKYVIFTAHQDTEKDNEGKTVAVTPLVGSERTHEKFQALCAHVIQFTMTMGGARHLIINNNGLVMAKCRSQAASALAPKGVCEKPLHEIIHLL